MANPRAETTSGKTARASPLTTAALLPVKYKIDLYYPIYPLRLLRQHHAQRLR